MSSSGVVGWLMERREWCIGLIRIYLGVGLFMKGVSFAAHRDELLSMMREHDLPFTIGFVAHYIILAHILGGFLMAVGLATRVGALIQIPILVGAVAFIHWGGGVFTVAEELRFSALVLFLLLIFVWHGSGPLSIDESVMKKAAEEAG